MIKAILQILAVAFALVFLRCSTAKVQEEPVREYKWVVIVNGQTNTVGVLSKSEAATMERIVRSPR